MPHPVTAAYNASKAAVSQYSNTLRLELEPLDVKVVELVTGRVASGLISVPTLSESSIYKPLEATLQSRAREAGQLLPPPVSVCACARETAKSDMSPNTLEQRACRHQRCSPKPL